MNWATVAAAVVGGLGGLGGLAAFTQAVFSRSKVRAEAADVLTDSALKIVREVQDRESILQGRVRDLENEIDKLHRRLRQLERDLSEKDTLLSRLKPDAM